MSKFSEINELRKSGKIPEAYTNAVEFLTEFPENIWAKRAMAWVLIALLKENAYYSKKEDYLKYFEEFINLKIPVEKSEELVFTNFGYWFAKFSSDLFNQKNFDFNTTQKLFDLIKLFDYPKPSYLHSKILSTFIKTCELWNNFYDFVNWWKIDNLRKEDFEKEKMLNGKEIISIAERTHISISKYLIKNFKNNPSLSIEIDNFILKLEEIEKLHPDFIYIPYYIGKLLLSKGQNENALLEFLPFARKKTNDFWVWEMLGDILTDEEQKFACYSRALLCNATDKMLVSLRPKFAELLISKKFYDEARFEIDKTIETRNKEKWKIPGFLMIYQAQEWYKNAKLIKNNFNFYKKFSSIANYLLYNDFPSHLGVVDFVNSDKKILNFVVSKEINGFFKYDNFFSEVKTGDFIELKLEKRKSGNGEYYQVLYAQKTEISSNENYKEVSGNIKANLAKKIGFIENCFISPQLFEKYNLENYSGKDYKAKAILSFNKIRNEWSWKVVELTENN